MVGLFLSARWSNHSRVRELIFGKSQGAILSRDRHHLRGLRQLVDIVFGVLIDTRCVIVGPQVQWCRERLIFLFYNFPPTFLKARDWASSAIIIERMVLFCFFVRLEVVSRKALIDTTVGIGCLFWLHLVLCIYSPLTYDDFKILLYCALFGTHGYNF